MRPRVCDPAAPGKTPVTPVARRDARGRQTWRMDASRFVPSWMRLVHRWYAEMTGDFWRRCILCRREYGGHEWRARPGAIPDPNRGVGHVITICAVCTR